MTPQSRRRLTNITLEYILPAMDGSATANIGPPPLPEILTCNSKNASTFGITEYGHRGEREFRSLLEGRSTESNETYFLDLR